jgi:CRP-like cAMP-binding protein
MNNYISKIDDFVAKLDPKIQKELLSLATLKTYEKGSYLLMAGEVCKKNFLIEEGIVRKFYLNDGKDITTEFFFKDDIAISFKSYITQEPSKENIIALEKTIVSVTNHEDVQKIQEKYPILWQLELLMMHQYIIWFDQQLIDFHTLDATQRYNQLISKAPHIVQNVPLTNISSYLGISLETLSRIRAKKQ